MLIKGYESYPKQSAHLILLYSEYLMLGWRITSYHPSDTLGTSIRYCSADLYNTYTMYHPLDIRWHVLNDTMSQYYLNYYRILGLDGVFWQPIQHRRQCSSVGIHSIRRWGPSAESGTVPVWTKHL